MPESSISVLNICFFKLTETLIFLSISLQANILSALAFCQKHQMYAGNKKTGTTNNNHNALSFPRFIIALHLFFQWMADEFNNLGMEFQYTGIKGITISVPYTMAIVKDFVWRPIQIALFNIGSTKDITTEQINEILDVLIKFFGEQGVPIEFPNEFGLYVKSLNEKEN